ncbi:MAG: CZB domain-containing protein [Rhodanobacter sp.]|jgi:hypothetical protein|nr:CZB domain-containing protein [Rhodanobacter sp.]
MFTTIKGWFGLSKENKETLKDNIRSEINIMDAVVAHVKWKIRLEDYLNGTSTETLDPIIICRDDQCTLGKWIYGPALKYFSDSDEFRQLRTDHARFHFLAGNVVKKVQENDRASAEVMMTNEYPQVSHKVVRALSELNRQMMEK